MDKSFNLLQCLAGMIGNFEEGWVKEYMIGEGMLDDIGEDDEEDNVQDEEQNLVLPTQG